MFIIFNLTILHFDQIENKPLGKVSLEHEGAPRVGIKLLPFYLSLLVLLVFKPIDSKTNFR